MAKVLWFLPFLAFLRCLSAAARLLGVSSHPLVASSAVLLDLWLRGRGSLAATFESPAWASVDFLLTDCKVSTPHPPARRPRRAVRGCFDR